MLENTVYNDLVTSKPCIGTSWKYAKLTVTEITICEILDIFHTPWCQTLEWVDSLIQEKVNKSIEKLITGKTDLWTLTSLASPERPLRFGKYSISSCEVTLGADQSALSLIPRSSTSGMVPKVLLSWCLGNVNCHFWLEKSIVLK